MWHKRCQWASSAPYVLPASILPQPLGAKEVEIVDFVFKKIIVINIHI